MAEKQPVKPRRGDLIIIEKVESTHFVTVGRRERRWFYVYEVVGLFRDGRVRAVRKVTSSSNSHPEQVEGPRRMLGLVQTYLLAATDVNKDGVVEAAREHCYPNSDTPMPFDSLDAVRELVKPFRRAVA